MNWVELERKRPDCITYLFGRVTRLCFDWIVAHTVPKYTWTSWFNVLPLKACINHKHSAALWSQSKCSRISSIWHRALATNHLQIDRDLHQKHSRIGSPIPTVQSFPADGSAQYWQSSLFFLKTPLCVTNRCPSVTALIMTLIGRFVSICVHCCPSFTWILS